MAGEVRDYQLLPEDSTQAVSTPNNAAPEENLLDLSPQVLSSLISQTSPDPRQPKKASPPPGYQPLDPGDLGQGNLDPFNGTQDIDQDSSLGSTREYQSSRAIDPDLFDEENYQNDVMGLQPRKPIGQNLHFTKPARLLLFYGIASVVLGVGIAACGAVSFALSPRLQSRFSFQVEWKWTNLVAVFSGFSAILLVYRQTLTSICSTLIFSLIAICMGVCTSIVHVVNFCFRRKDVAYYEEHKEPETASIAQSVSNTNLVIVLLGLMSSVISALVYRHSLHVTGKNFGYTIHIDRHRLRLSMLGLSQLITGLLITAWWIGIETIFQGKNVDFHALPTSEVLGHGMVISIAGYIQMMATAKGNQPLLICAAALNGASFLLTAFFSARPLSIAYLVIEHSSGTMEDAFDIRFVMCAILCLFYLVEMMISVYSLIKFVHFAAGDRISRIDNFLDRPRRLFTILSYCQVFIGVLYAILEVIAVSLLFLYKLDFSPLPLLVVASGVFSYGAVRMGSAMLITVTSAVCSLCAAFSLRDIYLFAYHTISHGLTPDNPTSMRMRSGNLAMHFVIALVALIEIILTIAIQALYLRTMTRSVAGIFNKMEFPRVLKYLRIATIFQIIFALLIIILGLVIFLSRTRFLLVFGDYSLTFGFLLLSSGIIALFVVRKPVLILPSIASQLCALTLVWQQSDEFAYLITNYMDGPHADDPSAGVVALSFVNFVLFIGYLCFCAPAILLQGAVLEGTRFVKLDCGPKNKMEELVSLGLKQQGTATTALDEVREELEKKEEENVEEEGPLGENLKEFGRGKDAD